MKLSDSENEAIDHFIEMVPAEQPDRMRRAVVRLLNRCDGGIECLRGDRDSELRAAIQAALAGRLEPRSE